MPSKRAKENLIKALREAVVASHPIDINQYTAELDCDDITCEVTFTCPKGGKIMFFNVYWNENTGEPLQYETDIRL